MAEKVDYGTLKKGGFMRQKQKNNLSLRLAVVGGYLTSENLTKIAEVAEKYGGNLILHDNGEEFEAILLLTGTEKLK